MELHGSTVLSDERKTEDYPECADERGWLGEELEKALEDEDQQDGDSCERYTPQLMDTQEMRALRAALHRSEVQIRTQGRMQEYVPRKPAPLLTSALHRRHGTPRYTMSAGSSPRLVASDASARNTESEGSSHMETSPKRPMTAAAAMPTTSKPKRMELKRMLGQEVRQLRELERQYEDTKRALLEYMEVVTSCKPNDRVGGQEVYEQLADLLAFAAQCSTSVQRD